MTKARVKQSVCLFLMLTSFLFGFSFVPRAGAEMVISSITPVQGNVGTQVQVNGNLTTVNGRYNVTFDGAVQVVDNATGNNVNATFIVPEAATGNHTIEVVDVNTGETATAIFFVMTAYYMNVSVPEAPRQLQEGDSVPISVNVTGGQSSSSLVLAVTVDTPLNVSSYTKEFNISTSNAGSGEGQLVYPADFSAKANTSYVGDYAVFLNSSIVVAAFSVGLTNSTEYHRMQTVNIKAIYAPNENVTLTVSGEDLSNSVNLTAGSTGVLDYTGWAVPANASVGIYNVSIVSVSATGRTVKVPPDLQGFLVPGFAFNVTARNLAGDPVPGIEIRAYENETSVSNRTTGSGGEVLFRLEIGNYTLRGYFKGVAEVGEGLFEVTNTAAVDLELNLTNLNVRVFAVVNGAEIGIPEVTVYLTTDLVNLTTDITGHAVAHSLLPNVDHTFNVSRYGEQFNVTTIAKLFVDGNLVPVFYVNVSCPAYKLQVSAFEAGGQPFNNATVEVKELLGGVQYDGSTDSNGIVAFEAMLGVYDVEVHDSTGRKLNETSVNLFQDMNVTVDCDLFGLNISVTVTDYFGQPFAGVDIKLQGRGFGPISKNTQSDGMVTFDNLVGDSMYPFTISVYLSDGGPPTEVRSLLVEGSASVQIRIGRYVLLAGFLVETGQLLVAVIIVLTLLLVLSLEVYRRRRRKSKETEG